MRVAFFSNYLNHHQLPFCLAMDRLTGGRFTFVATTPVPEKRLQLGYHDMNKQYPFVLTTYDNMENEWTAERLALECDVIITGSAPEKYTVARIRNNRLTFRCSERIYKDGLKQLCNPRHLRGMYLDHLRYRGKPLYMLCASAYTAYDYSLLAAYRNKVFKWGYFPEVKTQDAERLMQHKRNNERVSILWVGRLIDWKHPETAVDLAERLRYSGRDFSLDIIGGGEMEEQLRERISQRNLHQVSLLGNMSPEAVREHMEAADIFLFTSDFNEGWGAVLNEAMNSGCAVVASHAIGSVPFLIEDRQNGLIYRNGDSDSLYQRVLCLIDQPQLREKLGVNAYRSLTGLWNAETAAQRFLELAQALRNGETAPSFENGPCSKADILKNGWYNG